MSPEQKLWQSVVVKALVDATAVDPHGQESRRARREADSWLRHGGRDFFIVCSMAGLDPHFVREAYVEGRIDGELLRRKEKSEAA